MGSAFECIPPNVGWDNLRSSVRALQCCDGRGRSVRRARARDQDPRKLGNDHAEVGHTDGSWARFGKVMDRDENRAKSQNSTTLTLLADDDGAGRPRGRAKVDRSTRGPPRGTGSGHGSASPEEGPPVPCCVCVPRQLEPRRRVSADI